jgi:hypothetical protein
MEARRVKKRRLTAVIAIILLSGFAAHAASPVAGAFSAAVYANSRLLVFPLGAKEVIIPIPLMPRSLVYGASGRSLYATAFKQLAPKSFTDAPGMVKIDFNPAYISNLPGLDSFYALDRFAVSRREDMIVLGGFSRATTGSKTCGIYRLGIPTGNLHPIIESSGCVGRPWRVLDISPTADEALILADRRLARLNLTSGEIVPLGSQLWGGAYSPNGKWIAALELGGPNVPSRTILIDPQDPGHRNDLGGLNDTEVVWSPDSRLILHAVPRPACPSQNPLALEILDVQTRKRSIIANSVCKIGASRNIGWVRSDIAR